MIPLDETEGQAVDELHREMAKLLIGRPAKICHAATQMHFTQMLMQESTDAEDFDVILDALVEGMKEDARKMWPHLEAARAGLNRPPLDG